MYSISDIKNGIKNKKFSAVEITKDYINVAKSSKNNSFITITEDIAIEKAKESDKRISSGFERKLDGVPFAVKDIFCTKNILTTCASKMLSNFIPPYESTITNKLFSEGAIMIGKTNMDEFAMGSMNSNSYYGQCINHCRSILNKDDDLVPGGSSGGSAVSVAEGSSVFSLGTDTGGSVRQPAAFCGVVGVKPSYGSCSRYGMISYSSSLDQCGVFSKNVEDAGYILDIISGFDNKDSTSAKKNFYKFNSFLDNVKDGVKGLKVGIPIEYTKNGINSEILDKLDDVRKKLESLGAVVVDISLPNTSLGIFAYYIITTAEASSNLARYDGIKYGFSKRNDDSSISDIYLDTREYGFGEEVKRRICLGNFVLSSDKYEEYYVQATKIRRMIKNDFDTMFSSGIDVILTPTTPNLAFSIKNKPINNVDIYMNDALLVCVNLAGLPGISIPVGFSKTEQLPVGIQVISNYLEDAKMIQVGYAIEHMCKS